MKGGVWRVQREDGGEWEEAWDSTATLLKTNARERTGRRYWRTRQINRGVEVAELRESPAWDLRVLNKLAQRRCATKAVDRFRTLLWWNHLMTPEVLHRSTPAPEDVRCMHCGKVGVQDLWHLLGECPALTLRTARLARALGLGDLVKLEVIADEETPLPNAPATIEATRILADEALAQRLEQVLAAD